MAEPPTTEPQAPSAGALLRRAREAQGTHIAVLAAALKVPQRKLEALERDQLDALPDATFARALAQSMCRVLKVDAAPILALLPSADGRGLDQVSTGLNAPFRDKPTHADPLPARWLQRPAVIVVGLLLLAALAVWLWPQRSLSLADAGPAPAQDEAVPPPAAEPAPPEPGATPVPAEAVPAVPAVQAVQVASAAVAQAAPTQAAAVVVPPAAPAAELAQVPQVAQVAQGASSAANAVAALLELGTSAPSWIEVTDGAGRVLLSRIVSPGERLQLDGTPPLRLVVGNAAATEVRLRGQPVDLLAAASNNVARVELK